MITEINKATLHSIRNPIFRSLAEQYVDIYQDFIQQVQGMGLDFAEIDDSQQTYEKITSVGEKGAIVRNDRKSIYTNRISSGCIACQTAVGSHTFFISLKCHRNCFFCFNPNQENYEHFCENPRDVIAELKTLRASGQRVRHLALTGGEPLLHREETIRFFQQAREDFPKAYTRLYTCGDHLDRPTLQALQNAGLNEIRFSIRVEDTEAARHHTFNQIALTREYIPNVMVEMPVLPGVFDEMKAILLELDSLGIFGINLLEFCFPYHNAEEYRKRGYRIKAHPFRVLYNYWYAGGLPVAGSEEACLDLVAFALEAGLKLGVHYCSLENKHTGQIYQQNAERKNLSPLLFSQKDYFLKSAKVFGEDAIQAKAVFDKRNYSRYHFDPNTQTLEFDANKVKWLKELDIDVAISTNVVEDRNGAMYLRELKLDLTTPQVFHSSEI